MLVYCEKCHKVLNNWDVIDRNVVIRLKGVPYEIYGKEAICPTCGEAVLDPAVLKYNQEKVYDAYRKANNIISQDDILAIPSKYHVSKRNISKYLGWGEVTFSRYCSGDYIPTKHNSDVLKDILSHPEYLRDKIKKYIESHPDDKNAQRDLRKMSSSSSFDAVINMYWDDDSNVWTATSDDIPGLEMESASFDDLTEKVTNAIPELLKQNRLPDSAMIEFHASKKEMIFA